MCAAAFLPRVFVQDPIRCPFAGFTATIKNPLNGAPPNSTVNFTQERNETNAAQEDW